MQSEPRKESKSIMQSLPHSFLDSGSLTSNINKQTGQKYRSAVIWVTGFSSAGKTSVARELVRSLRDDGCNTIFLDGDQLRSIFANKWGYERDERVELGKIYFRLCSYLASQGAVVVIAAVAMYDEVRSWVHANVKNIIEAYLYVPGDERRKRDSTTKRVYVGKKNFESIYDPPTLPDIKIDNYGAMTPELAGEKIKNFFLKHDATFRLDRGRVQYWEDFYQSFLADKATLDSETSKEQPSAFALFAEKKLKEGSTLLEIGCGKGEDARYFTQKGHQIIACDTSSAAIALCKKTTSKENNTIEFICGDIKSTSIEAHPRIDAIYIAETLNALTPDEESELLSECYTRLKPEGMLFMQSQTLKDSQARQGEVLSPTERLLPHYRRFLSSEEHRRRIQNHGFTVISACEGKGLEPKRGGDPFFIRVHCKKVT